MFKENPREAGNQFGVGGGWGYFSDTLTSEVSGPPAKAGLAWGSLTGGDPKGAPAQGARVAEGASAFGGAQAQLGRQLEADGWQVAGR